jgi:hypothetical protein
VLVCDYHGQRHTVTVAPDGFGPPEPEHSAIPQRKGEPDDAASQSSHFLPKDLARALERLDDAEIDSLLAAVTAEAER